MCSRESREASVAGAGVGDEVKGAEAGGHGFRAFIVQCTHFLFILTEGTIGEYLAETSDRA